MCLAIPMCVVEINGLTVVCEAKGVQRTASLLLVQDEPLQVGDMVVVHLGQVIQKVSAEDARLAWALYDEMLAALPEAERAAGDRVPYRACG